MHILGITGGIATGKSTVTQMLAELGAPTISADAVAHALLAPGTPTTAAILAAFPTCADTAEPQKINRRALAQLIFADADARLRLEALTHPPIIEALRTQIAEWRQSGTARAAAAEIPLLFEAKLEWLVDSIVVVICSKSDQVSRLLVRDGVTETEAYRQVAAQWPLAQKENRADFIIATEDWGKDDTRRQVLALWESLSDTPT